MATRRATKSDKKPVKKTSQEKILSPIEFYKMTESFLSEKAKARGINDLEKYYRVTDTQMVWYKSINGEMNKCFAELVYHGQNATMISNIVKFQEKLDFLKEICFDFDPVKFYETYGSSCIEKGVEKLVSKLREDPVSNPNGLVWDSTESDNKDAIAKRFACILIYGSSYLKDFHSKHELINDLWVHGQNAEGEVDNKKLIDYFREKIPEGFSVALTCDFLKELDEKFSFLAKPDIHIMEVLGVYLKKGKGYYRHGTRRALECLADFQKIVTDINAELPEDKKISVYQFDRMIWLICSGSFFLDRGVGFEKSDFLSKISE